MSSITPEGPAITIGAAERETGLSKDVLRMWERRYGFPQPTRDGNGERAYAPADVAKLRTIKRLMDAGVRPGKIIRLDLASLHAMADARTPARPRSATPTLERDVLALLRTHDVAGLATLLTTLLLRQGVQQFVQGTIVPLNRAVGDAWMRGDLRLFEEHLYTEQVRLVLHGALHAFPRHAGFPRILVATLPGEAHSLGVLMVEAMLVPEGAHCICLGTQVPVDDIGAAAMACEVHIVVLAFAARSPARYALDGLASLRARLPADVALWAGGDGMSRMRGAPPGVVLLPDFAATLVALRDRRLDAGEPPA